MKKTYWEHFSHDANIGVRGIGASKEEAFEQAAAALTPVIADLYTVVPTEVVEVTYEAPDDERLFVDRLNALVYELATRLMLFSRFEVHIRSQHLHPANIAALFEEVYST